MGLGFRVILALLMVSALSFIEGAGPPQPLYPESQRGYSTSWEVHHGVATGTPSWVTIAGRDSKGSKNIRVDNVSTTNILYASLDAAGATTATTHTTTLFIQPEDRISTGDTYTTSVSVRTASGALTATYQILVTW
jgi:hypothetical protein